MSYDPYQNDDRNGRRRRRERERNWHESGSEQPEAVQFGGGGFGSRGGRPGGILGFLFSHPKLLLALALAAFALIKFVLIPSESNPVTDESHKIPWKPEQDVALGLQARGEMLQQFGGEHRDQRLQNKVDEIGMKLVRANTRGDWAPVFQQYKWDFHLLADAKTVNAFALPGGQIFFTYGLLSKLKTEDEVAGVLGHEIGHVIARHSAQQMAKSSLIQGLVMAGAVATSDGRSDTTRMAQAVSAMITMKYGRADESQSDLLGVQFMINAGYNPEGLVGVMEVLNAEMKGNRQPEFFSTHPNPEHRIEGIRAAIQMVRDGKLEGPLDVAPAGVEAR